MSHREFFDNLENISGHIRKIKDFKLCILFLTSTINTFTQHKCLLLLLWLKIKPRIDADFHRNVNI